MLCGNCNERRSGLRGRQPKSDDNKELGAACVHSFPRIHLLYLSTYRPSLTLAKLENVLLTVNDLDAAGLGQTADVACTRVRQGARLNF